MSIFIEPPAPSSSHRQVSDDGTIEPLKPIAVIGAGAFGTAMAQVSANCDNPVRIFARNTDVVNSINNEHINPKYLSEFKLNPLITATTSITEALDGVAFAILAIPTQLVKPINFFICFKLYFA